ncbi:NUDIX hydrolase [Fluviispira multicolorata]|uniref:GDP-mannose pyrophosphatase n=1 Tax=Fluviispira multicolorata TaxID=2654512 RepID=A0A833JBT1_9BACT|nr:NUDIX hydrolase [Fluviispira multicolorata]KAB8029831.1 NUDIX domain-containing protein [Fluviispira multicolorata]
MSNDNTTLEPFLLSEEKTAFQCSILRVKERLAQTNDKTHSLKVYTLDCANWVNVVPVTATGQVVLVEQHRFGTNSFTLEVPGGAVEKHEKDVTLAAVRELEEETGLTSQRILSLPGYSPNAAIQSNKVTYFIAFDVMPLSKPTEHNDPFEKIKLHLIDFKESLQMVRTGQITNVISAFALLLAEPYLNAKFRQPQ